MRRLLVGAAVLAAGLGLVSPAAAHPPSVTFDPPLGGRYTGQPPVGGYATHDGPGSADMDRVDLAYRSALAKGPGSCAIPAGRSFDGSGVRIDFADFPAFECNGRYAVEVVATSAAGTLHPAEQQRVSHQFEMAVPPAAPSDFRATPATTSVSLRWRANTEKDLYGYLVDRRTGSGAFETVAVTNATSYVDEPERPGEYVYRVWAIRLGPQQDPGNEDDLVLSAAPSSSQNVTYTGPTTTTSPPTTDGPGGGSGGGSAPGSGGGDPGSGGSTDTTGYTIPPTPPPPAARKADLSGFQELKAQVEAERRLRSTTTDPGYSETLPYEGGRRGGGEGPEGSLAAGPNDRSTFEEIVDRRAALVPVAGGLVLFVGALQLRYLTRRAARSES